MSLHGLVITEARWWLYGADYLILSLMYIFKTFPQKRLKRSLGQSNSILVLRAPESAGDGQVAEEGVALRPRGGTRSCLAELTASQVWPPAATPGWTHLFLGSPERMKGQRRGQARGE